MILFYFVQSLFDRAIVSLCLYLQFVNKNVNKALENSDDISVDTILSEPDVRLNRSFARIYMPAYFRQ